MDAIEQLEAELKVLDAPVSAKPKISPQESAEVAPVADDNASDKLKAAETLVAALDNLSEYVLQARDAAHGLVEALSPVEATGHPLTVETASEEPTTPKESDDDEVPQKL